MMWSYEDYDADLDESGWVREEELPDIDFAKEMMEGIIEAVYKTGNVAKLEDCLDELVNCFDMELPKEEPVLERIGPSETANELLRAWVTLNDAHNHEILEQTRRRIT